MPERALEEKVRSRIHEVSQQLRSSFGRKIARGSTSERLARDDLQHEGVHVTTLGRLLCDMATGEAIARASHLLRSEHVRVKPALWSRSVSSTDLDPGVMLELAPELYLLGLHPALLRLARQYLGLPVAYHGAVLRHSLIDGRGTGPRLWHQDGEDFHVLRVIVYLSDVTEGAGPFEYIPRYRSLTYREMGPIAGAELTNELVGHFVPPTQWRRCLGKAGTVVLADTAKVFHHESLQLDTERFVLMMGYSSRRPKSLELAEKHFPVEALHSKLIPLVPPDLYPYVFDWRST